MKKHRQYGFTLVELLIVIVIIAILAAITIVAYNGIQNRANDSAVQSDLRNFANLVLQYQAVNGNYPSPNTLNTAVSGNEGIGKTKPVGTEDFFVSKDAYATNVHNFIYCEGYPNTDKTGDLLFAVGGMSKSGNTYVYYSNGGLKQYTGSWSGGVVSSVCPALGVKAPDSGGAYYYAYGYNSGNAKWFTGWTH